MWIPAAVGLMKWAAWKKCIILSSASDDFVVTAGTLSQKLSEVNIKVEDWISAYPGKVTTENLERLQSTNVRVVFVLMPCADIQDVAVLGKHLGMMQQGWGWIEFGESIVACEFSGGAKTAADVAAALHGWLYLEPVPDTTQPSLQGVEGVLPLGAPTFQSAFGPGQGQGRHAANLYDAVYLFALAADALLRQGTALNHRGALLDELRNTTFVGLRGRVTLDSNGDRVEKLGIMNYLGQFNATVIGQWSVLAGFSRLPLQPLVWPGGGAAIPSDEGVHT
jgi:hypothetical protein